jgi:hypothetical protein
MNANYTLAGIRRYQQEGIDALRRGSADDIELALANLGDAVAELDAHLSAGGTPPEAWREGPDVAPSDIPTMAERLDLILSELDDIRDSADDIGWLGVRHKAEAAMGDVGSALTAARQYESGEREASE